MADAKRGSRRQELKAADREGRAVVGHEPLQARMPRSVVCDVIQRNARTVRLRAPGPADESDLTVFFDELDPESRYRALTARAAR